MMKIVSEEEHMKGKINAGEVGAVNITTQRILTAQLKQQVHDLEVNIPLISCVVILKDY